jgi:uncharacterized protein DUF1707
VPEPSPGEVGVDRLRASDADREAVVERLRRAHAEGRLDLAEFDDRTRDAYAARTYAELATLTSDLPAERGVSAGRPRAVASDADADADAARRRGGLGWRIVGSAWFFASFVNLVIWAIVCVASAEFVHPWWIWVAGPWGAVLLARWLGNRARGED